MISIAALGAKDVPKTLVVILIGLFLGTVGMDLFTSRLRFTYGNIYLVDGIDLVSLLAGLFALAEVYEMSIGDVSKIYVTDSKKASLLYSSKDF